MTPHPKDRLVCPVNHLCDKSTQDTLVQCRLGPSYHQHGPHCFL